MGRYADFYKAKGSHFLVDKRMEFEARVLEVFRAGGMMEMEEIHLHEKRITLIKPVEMHEDGIDVYYNYLEDSYWENAGYSKGGSYIWSNKVGGDFFLRTVLAAYRLQEHYTEGTCVTLLDGKLIISGDYIGWLNYLFGEKYLPKNFDPWKLFESYYHIDESYVDWDALYDDIGYAFIGACEICAVLHGTASALAKYDGKRGGLEGLALSGMMRMSAVLQQYASESELDKNAQLKQVMSLLRTYYEAEGLKCEALESYEGTLNDIVVACKISEAPAFAVKAISEIYEKDFWELWSEIADVAGRKDIYEKKGRYMQPISTAEWFRLSHDDMIFYWEENGDVVFSDKLWNWFRELKLRFDQWIETDFTFEKPLTYLLDLMEEADSTYYRIYTFSSFFEETLEHLQDKRYQVLWKLYEEMIHDSELKAAGKAISEERRFSAYSWEWMDLKRRNNKGRVTLRRYMALMANQPLRQKVFGV